MNPQWKNSSRPPAVAGKFYPLNQRDLQNILDALKIRAMYEYSLPVNEGNLIGGVVPHAGYVYSGYQAACFFELLSRERTRYDTFVIIHPNHRYDTPPLCLDSHAFWQTPLGWLESDTELGSLLGLQTDERSHAQEHSGEVVLPFLQHFIRYHFKILVISMNKQSHGNALLLARKLADAAAECSRRICIIASSDFSHFVSPEAGKRKDDKVLAEIMAMNPKGVEAVVKHEKVSVCGFGPVMCLMEYAKLLKPAATPVLIARGHSGEVVPSDEVVHYISIGFFSSD